MASLAGAEGVAPHSVDGGGGVDEHCVPVTVLLALVQGAKGLVYCKGLRVEDLFFGSEVVAASDPPILGPPDVCRSHPAAVLPRAVDPDSFPAAPPATDIPVRDWKG